MNWLYLVINIGSIAIPLAFSFESKIRFWQSWRFLFPALFITAGFFIIWDFWFTDMGIWHFNEKYVLGMYWVNLPFEEWLFFLFIPYACVFIHEAMKVRVKQVPFEKHGNRIAIGLSVLCIAGGLIFYERMYTTVTLLLLGVFLQLNVFVFKSWFMARFFLTYLISCIPFALVNGLLTAMPVLIYNNSENLSIRLGTIPLEDCFYSMLMLLMNITLFEHLRAKRLGKNAVS